MLNVSHVLPYLTLTTLWEGCDYDASFTDEENETEEIKSFTEVLLGKASTWQHTVSDSQNQALTHLLLTEVTV